MKISELRAKLSDNKKVIEFLKDKKVEIRKKRFLQVDGSSKNIHEKREMRKEIARAHTILKEHKSKHDNKQ